MTSVVDGARYFLEAQSENDFMRNVLAYAAKRAWTAYHTHISKRSTEGFPDLVFVRGGRIVIAELKREIPEGAPPSMVRKCSPTEAQSHWLAELGAVVTAIVEQFHRDAHGDAAGCGDCVDRASNIMGVYLWRPSDWPTIEEVLR